MTFTLCRNEALNFNQWREVCRSHESAHRDAGLVFGYLWSDLEVSNAVQYLYRAEDNAQTKASIAKLAAATAAEFSGGHQW
jgi:hypothetical protein